MLAAYGCLAPRLITGRFDPTSDRAVWPSTGNYCRGGVAISRLLGCHGVAVLPEGMSRERFAWLEQWVVEPDDIIRTPGVESNVKEIYDRCHELAEDPDNVILNQFAEFGNHIAHYLATGAALERVFESLREQEPELRLRAFVSATGSAGTIAAGDYLKERLGSLIVAVEAAECPTMLRNGFGEHNIQGIGDKHIPLIHNVLNTDVALAVSDRATDRLGVLFSSAVGRRYLADRCGVSADVLAGLPSLGLSSICNVLGAIKTAKHYGMGPEDVIVTVATDGDSMYASEHELALAKYFPRGFDEVAAGEVFGEHLLGAATDNLLELTSVDRDRIFNLGYYTWVEQQGISLEDFEARRSPAFWSGIHELVRDWDALIDEFNARTGRAGGAVTAVASRLVCAGCGAEPDPRDPYPVPLPGGPRPATTSTTSSGACSTRPAVRFPLRRPRAEPVPPLPRLPARLPRRDRRRSRRRGASARSCGASTGGWRGSTGTGSRPRPSPAAES